MRLRKVANAEAILEENKDWVILEPHLNKGKWNERFGNSNPIHIEVGMGKGQFLLGMAALYPNINFIGIEVVPSVLVRAVKKAKELAYKNVMLINVDAAFLAEVFETHEIARIYLNFSDPWPKSRHEKRRLTSQSFLSVFEKILVEKGSIHLKTDNEHFFEYSVVSLSHYPMSIDWISIDLHKSDFENNIMTEYEARFTALGQRIFRLEATFL